jgi:hypothetical protein
MSDEELTQCEIAWRKAYPMTANQAMLDERRERSTTLYGALEVRQAFRDGYAALEAENAGLRARVEGLESELKTANHWRERHSRDAEAYGQQSAKNWKRVRELEEELRAALTPTTVDGPAGCALCGPGPWEPCARIDHGATPTTAGGTEKCEACGGSGEQPWGDGALGVTECRSCHGTGRATAGGGKRT